MDVGYLRAQYAVIGWLFGTAALGSYQRADSTQQIANDSAATVIGRVALPIFAGSTSRPDLLRAGFRTGVRTTSAFTAPVMAIMAALAEPMLAAVFGPQWTTAGPLLAALAIAGMLWPFHVMAVNVLYAAGQNRLVFRLDIVKKAAGMIFLFTGAVFGLVGVAVAQIGFSLSAVLINGWAVRRSIGLSMGAQVAGTASPIGLALLVGCGVKLADTAYPLGPWPAALLYGGVGLASYFLLARALRLQAILDVMEGSCLDLAGGGVPRSQVDVSILVLAYNHAPFIAECLDGLLAQDFGGQVEILIGEDCSTDATPEIVAGYARLHPQIRVISSESNVGMFLNHRRLLAATRGTYVAYCEGDDDWHESSKVRLQVAYLDRHQELSGVCSDVDHLIPRGNGWARLCETSGRRS